MAGMGGKRTLAAFSDEALQRRGRTYFSLPVSRLENDATLGFGNRFDCSLRRDGKVVTMLALPCRQRPCPLINGQLELGRLPRTARNHKLRLTFARANERRAFPITESVKQPRCIISMRRSILPARLGLPRTASENESEHQGRKQGAHDSNVSIEANLRNGSNPDGKFGWKADV